MRKALFSLAMLCFLSAFAAHAEEKKPDPDEELLRKAGVATDDAGLRKYLRECAEYDAKVRRILVLIRQLGAEKFLEREKASAELIEIGREALPTLKEATKDRDVEIARRANGCYQRIDASNDPGYRFGRGARAAVLLVLLNRGCKEADAEFFVDELLTPHDKWVNDTQGGVKYTLWKSLRGPELNGLGHPEKPKEMQAMRSFSGPVLRALFRAAEDGPTERREAARAFLAKLGWPAVKEKLDAIQAAKHGAGWAKAIQQFPKVDGASWPLEDDSSWFACKVAPVLLDALKDSDPRVREAAADRLGWMVPEANTVVPALAAALGDREEKVRLKAAGALSAIGPQARLAIPALLEGVKGKDGKLRSACAHSLVYIDPEQPAIIAVLLEELKDKDPAVRFDAIWAAYWMGPPAEPLVSQLIEVFKNPGEEDRKNDGGRSPRMSILMALTSIGRSAKKAIPFLVKVAKDNPEHRPGALGALGAIGPLAAKGAMPTLLRLLKDNRAKEERDVVIWTLGRFGSAAKPAVPFLVAILKDKEQKYHDVAANALMQIEPETGREMLQILRRENPVKESEGVRNRFPGKRRCQEPFPRLDFPCPLGGPR